MSKHTPGPWAITGKTWEGDGAAGVMVEAESGGAIAFVTSWTDRGLPTEVDEANYANARLIVAAPLLLNACKQAREFLKTIAHNTDDMDALDAAIAAAEGDKQ